VIRENGDTEVDGHVSGSVPLLVVAGQGRKPGMLPRPTRDCRYLIEEPRLVGSKLIRRQKKPILEPNATEREQIGKGGKGPHPTGVVEIMLESSGQEYRVDARRRETHTKRRHKVGLGVPGTRPIQHKKEPSGSPSTEQKVLGAWCSAQCSCGSPNVIGP